MGDNLTDDVRIREIEELLRQNGLSMRFQFLKKSLN